MATKKSKKQVKLPKTPPQFEQAIRALSNTPPISNKELIERGNKQKKNTK